MASATDAKTAAALLDAAEARFAADGFGGASLRAIMRDAQTDPGAIHYHFGGRPALAVGVLDRVLVPLNHRRLTLLDALDPGDPVSVESLVRALLQPDIDIAADLAARGDGRARLVRAIYLEPETFVLEQVERRFAPVATRFAPRFAAALPSHPMSEIAWRIRWCVFPMVGAVLGDHAAASDRAQGERGGDDALAARLVAAATGALSAPPTGPDLQQAVIDRTREDHP